MPRPCRVFLSGEGATDVGDLCLPEYHRMAHAAGKRPRPPREGFYQPLLRRLAGEGFDLVFEGCAIRTLGKEILEPKDALSRKARGALALAATNECSILVFATDTDRHSGRPRSQLEAARQHDTKRRAIEAGFAAAVMADPDLAGILRVVAIPCRMMESWALADRAALATVIGRKATLPGGSPEHYWGNEDDPASNHPKRVLQRAFGEDVDAGFYVEIAEAASIAALERACPLSFRPFSDQVAAIKRQCEIARSVRS
jgi:hypothetical protein